MISVTRMEELFTNLLETKADELARSTGFVQRARKLSGADFVQILTFGHLRAPTSSLDQLTQVAQLRDVQISSEGAHQRLTEPAARGSRKPFWRKSWVRCWQPNRWRSPC